MEQKLRERSGTLSSFMSANGINGIPELPSFRSSELGCRTGRAAAAIIGILLAGTLAREGIFYLLNGINRGRQNRAANIRLGRSGRDRHPARRKTSGRRSPQRPL